MARVRGTRPARSLAIVSIVALALGVGALAVLAYERATPATATGSPAPVPTFEFGAKTPAPTAAPTAAPIAREAQRLLAVSSQRWWRATVGVCGGPAPLIERSDDQGATWADVTPLYRGVAQVQTLDAFSPLDAELVSAVDGCSAEALRTYTGGEFWDPYPDVLAASRFVEPLDAGSVHLPGRNVPAPCPTASGLHAAGDVITLLCDGRAWSWSGDDWTQLAPTDASALAIDDTDVIVAHRSDECAGLSISRVPAADPEGSVTAACVEGVDPAQAVAISVAGAEVFVWSGDAITRVPAPPVE